MYSAGAPTNIYVSFKLIQRIVTPAFDAIVAKGGGYLKTDLIETAFNVPLGVSGPFTANIPTPGSYCDLMFRQYLGGATVTRDEISQLGPNTAAADYGIETIWSIISGQTTYHSFRFKDLKASNDLRQFFARSNQTYAPRLGAPLGTNNLSGNAASTSLDFISDGVGGADNVSELGSVLNANIAQGSGLLLQLSGNVANVATNASVLWLSGYRIYGNLAAYQALM